MIVCHCKAVSDREVRRAVAEGARTRGEVARRCGAGTVCGGCRPLVQEIVTETVAAHAAPAAPAEAARDDRLHLELVAAR